MARIAGVDLPAGKRVETALAYLYGIGPALAARIVKATGIKPDTRVKNLAEDEIVKLREAVGRYRVEGDLRRELTGNIKRLMEIGSYRGSRHRRNLPARGQRTRTNARTRRGKRKTIGRIKKVEEKKE